MFLTRYILLAAALLLTAACHSNGAGTTVVPGAPEPVEHSVRGNPGLEAQMRAIVSGNAEADADQAVQAGDRQLWVYYQRGQQVVPGGEGLQVDLPVRAAPGMGDMIYGETHKALRRQMLDYMQRYNRRILSSGR